MKLYLCYVYRKQKEIMYKKNEMIFEFAYYIYFNKSEAR